MKPGRCVIAGVDQVQQRCRHEQTGEKRSGDMPADSAGVEQIEAAEGDQIRDPLPPAPAEVSKQGSGANLGERAPGPRALLDEVERCRARQRVDGALEW